MKNRVDIISQDKKLRLDSDQIKKLYPSDYRKDKNKNDITFTLEALLITGKVIRLGEFKHLSSVWRELHKVMLAYSAEEAKVVFIGPDINKDLEEVDYEEINR